MVHNVTINTHLTFEDRAAARLAAQAFELIAKSAKHVGGGVRITDLATGLNVTVHEQVLDRSKFVKGFQAAEEQVRKVTTAIDKRANIVPSQPEFWRELFEAARSTGEVDFVLLTSLATQRFGFSDETTRTVVADAIAEVAAAAAQREYTQAVTPPKVRK